VRVGGSRVATSVLGRSRARAATWVSAAALTVFASSWGAAALASGVAGDGGGAARLGTATATVAQTSLDVKVLPGLLGGSGLDLPINLTLHQETAPTDGTLVNDTSSVLKLRDDLLGALGLPAQSADLIKADAVSDTVRTTPGYSQAYVTLANVRLFLPLLSLPSSVSSDGALRLDAVSAVATCVAGQRPTAQFQLPAQLTLFGQNVQLPANGTATLSLPLLGSITVQLGPQTITTATSASAAVRASLDINVLGVAELTGQVTLASATCTSPRAGTSTMPPTGTPSTPSTPGAPASTHVGGFGTGRPGGTGTGTGGGPWTAGRGPLSAGRASGGALGSTSDVPASLQAQKVSTSLGSPLGYLTLNSGSANTASTGTLSLLTAAGVALLVASAWLVLWRRRLAVPARTRHRKARH
jgi:hypothetical protein